MLIEREVSSSPLLVLSRATAQNRRLRGLFFLFRFSPLFLLKARGFSGVDFLFLTAEVPIQHLRDLLIRPVA